MSTLDQIRFEDGIIKTPKPKFIPDPRGLGYTFFTAMSGYKDKIMQIDGVTGEEDSYGSVLQRSIRTAIKMQLYGVTKDDTITICSFNHLDVWVPFIAATFLGAKLCNLDSSLSLHDGTEIARQINPKLIFAGLESVEFVEKIFAANNKSRTIIAFGDTPNYIKYSEFLQACEEENNFTPIQIECLQDIALIIFSSGTTGIPKGYCISHQAYLGRLGAFATMESCYDLSLTFTRLYWVTSTLLWFGILLAGGCRIVIPQFDVHNAWLAINKFKPTFIFVNVFQMASLFNDSYVGKRDTSSLKLVLSSGAPIFEHQLLNYRKMFPTMHILSIYGSTECGIITYFPKNTEKEIEFMKTKIKSAGMASNGLSYKVVDLDTRKPLGPYQKGELLIKTDYQTSGYLNLDSSVLFDSDGWLKTGDVVYFDEDFYFYHTERMKELLKFRFGHLAPSILEHILLTHPKIQDACVIGSPHEIDIEHPLAVVVLKHIEINSNIEEDIIRYVSERVEDKYQLRAGVKIIDELPFTESGKVDRRKLRRMCLADNKLYIERIQQIG